MANGYWVEVRRQGSGWEPYALPTAYSARDAAAATRALAEVLIPDEAVIDIPVVTTRQTLSCPLLVDGRCSAYDVRPAICRIWGTLRQKTSPMHCPHGCRPKRWLSDAEARAILDAVRALSPVLRALHADFDEQLRGENAELAPGGLKPLDDPPAIR